MIRMWKFVPIYKHTLWGGEAISALKNVPCYASGIGESWEISALPGDISVVSEGADKGSTIEELAAKHQEHLLGKNNWERYGRRFPLLIKFIDARENLSLQVHPDDEIAHKAGLPNGKDEMWYIISAEKDAWIASGFKEELSPEKFEMLIESGEILQHVNIVPAKAGTAFYIPGGKIHAIGEGVLLAEIQQTADITYRIHDYNRTDKAGNFRELHRDRALETVNLSDTFPGMIETGAESASNILNCKHFDIALLHGCQSHEIHCKDLDSFVILTCIQGSAEVSGRRGEMSLRRGETMLLAADEDLVKIKAADDFKALSVAIINKS